MTFEVAIDDLELMAARLEQAGTTFRQSVKPKIEPAQQGVEWPILFGGYQAQVNEAHNTCDDVSSRLAEGIGATGTGLVEVARAYRALERDV